MKKRFVFRLVSLVLMSGLLLQTTGAAMDNFMLQRLYRNQFTDVSTNAWYQVYVKKTYELGLYNGVKEDRFAPNNNVTVAEAVALAARIYAQYQGNRVRDAEDGAWYMSYVTYAEQQGILSATRAEQLANEATYANAAATRSEFASFIYRALPIEEYAAINTVSNGAIPDVTDDEAVYDLYRAGVLTGNGDTGAFLPNEAINRAEVAAIIARVVDPTLRQAVPLGASESERNDPENA